MDFEMHLRTLIRFDVLVNGGGAVTLQFQRSPFKPLTRTVFVPWNQIVVLPPIVMVLSKEGETYKSNQPPSPAMGKHSHTDTHTVFLFFPYRSGLVSCVCVCVCVCVCARACVRAICMSHHVMASARVTH